MKKILIITRHAVPNYGSFLQALATVKIFENRGYTVQILDYVPELEKPENLYKPMLNSSRFGKKPVIRLIYKLVRKPDFKRMGKRFRKFQKQNLPLTKEYNSYESLVGIDGFDIYMTGSDQVWGPMAMEPFNRCYFWDFLAKDATRVAYSASFGNAHFSQETQAIYKEMLEKYAYLLVRENTAVELLNQMGIHGAEQVLDPTLMFSREFWEKYTSKNSRKKKYLLVYQVHDNKNMEKYAKQLANKMGLELVRVSNSFAHVFRGGKFEYLPDPGQFLSLFKHAEYVVTNSFHATVFSLIFERPFSIVNSGKTNTRIESLLSLVQLGDRQIENCSDFSQIEKEIDFEKVKEILDKERMKSNTAIDTMLESI